MKAKIIMGRPNTWYELLTGEIIEVREHNKDQYVHWSAERGFKLIDRSDCNVIEERSIVEMDFFQEGELIGGDKSYYNKEKNLAFTVNNYGNDGFRIRFYTKFEDMWIRVYPIFAF